MGQYKILHISAHYGGGVGTVMNAWKNNDSSNEHRFTHLNNISINTGELFTIKLVNEYDVIICHVWNHPAMFEFLLNTNLPKCRLIVWSHISGLQPPEVYFNKLIEYSDKFIFTTPVSMECLEIRNLPEYLKNKLSVIWSTYDINNYIVQRIPHEGFNVGFVGTADYGKLHPKFIDMCAGVKSPVTFLIGSHDSQEHLKSRARDLQVYDRFVFKGKVPSVAEHLTLCDVFGYPLQSAHFGSCEQALGEAMACGAVPVVFGNLSERYIVEHMRTGMVVESAEEYSKAIDYLFTHKEERERMSQAARIEAKQRYDIGRMISQWNIILDDVMKQEKKEKIWSRTKIAPYLVYATSLGKFGKPFVEYVFADLIGSKEVKDKVIRDIKSLYASNSAFLSENKGSIRQYCRYYPHDEYLQRWKELIDK